MPNVMKAIEIAQYGGPEVLKPTERPMPEPKAGEVLIRVRAAGVNRPDVFQRTGNYPVPPGASDIPGLEVAGEIVGGDLTHADNRYGLKTGDRVCALVQGGGYAEFCTAPLGQVLPVPAGLSDIEAAALPENYFTVWSNVFDRGQLGRGRMAGTRPCWCRAAPVVSAPRPSRWPLRSATACSRRPAPPGSAPPASSWVPRAPSITRPRISSRSSRPRRGVASTWCSTWLAAATSRARSPARRMTAASY
uniref:Enoyl reductase (ER) domain-containing protein n=1 Tax=blood disease bacterium R229 TaxID=741978 RepID=G2ZSH8_9RALS|nr:hypothetical protein BDB_180031 [blood disease bacterium R229]